MGKNRLRNEGFLNQLLNAGPLLKCFSSVQCQKSFFDSIGPWRHFAATQQFGSFRSVADIQRATIQNQLYEYAP
jgi:hypothetical protein